MLRSALLIALALVVGLGLHALGVQDTPPVAQEDAAAPEEELPPLWYAAILRPGKRWQAELPPSEQPGIEAHLDHLVAQFQAGKLVLGGPFLDDSGGLAVLRARSVEEARQLAGSDPAVKSGLLKVDSVHPWLVPLRALEEKKDADDSAPPAAADRGEGDPGAEGDGKHDGKHDAERPR